MGDALLGVDSSGSTRTAGGAKGTPAAPDLQAGGGKAGSAVWIEVGTTFVCRPLIFCIMRKSYKRKRRSCPLCKPHKVGWDKRWKPSEAAKRTLMERECRSLTERDCSL